MTGKSRSLASLGMTAAFHLVALGVAGAQQTAQAAIKDNSFLIEEAYNQDPGVVQHISTFSRPTPGSAWAYTFTQEWPVGGMRHQLSYTLPVFVAGMRASTGVGDFGINYRYQLAGIDGGPVAVAPRITVLLPTGNAVRGTGAGGASVQGLVPVSVELGERFVTHFNAGLTYTGSATNVLGYRAPVTSLTAGSSLVWLATNRFNVLVETLWNHNETVVGPGFTFPSSQLTVAPGVRWSHNLPHGVQIVPGIAYDIAIGEARDRSVFLYFSVEHPFTR